jgi:hypothetical protein
MEISQTKPALGWWRKLSREKQQEVAKTHKPHWTFDMFTRSTSAIRNAFLATDTTVQGDTK